MVASKHTIWTKIPSNPNHWVSIDGEALSYHRGKTKKLKVIARQDGYRQIEDGHIHRLIGMLFIPNAKNLPMVCHKDDVKNHNVIENLYWGDAFDNMRDASRNGKCYAMPIEWIRAAGEANLRTCTIDNGIEVKHFESLQKAAYYIGVSPSSLSQALKRGGKSRGYQITKHCRS